MIDCTNKIKVFKPNHAQYRNVFQQATFVTC